MKRLLTYLTCATLVASGSYAFQKVKHTGELNTRPSLPQIERAESGEITAERELSDRLKASIERMQRPTNPNSQNTSHTQSVSPCAVAAPFFCGFDTQAEFEEKWTLIDADGSGYAWEYDNGYYISGNGIAYCYYNLYSASDDYMITTEPVTLSAGDAYVSFEYGGLSSYGGYDEKLEVLYGTSADVEQMTLLQTYEFNNSRYELILTQAPITLAEGGDYYFAFHAASAADNGGIIVDNVEINNGAYTGTPDIVVSDLSLPLSSPVLATEQVTVTVSNQGTCGIASYSLSWSAECGGSTQSSEPEVIDIPLAVGESSTITLTAPIDMSATGTYHVTVTATAVVPEGDGNQENNTDNNYASSSTSHMGTTDVPFVTDFSNGEKPEQWTSDGSWYYSPSFSAMFCNDQGPMVSQGVNLTAGNCYRISYVYMAGYSYGGWLSYYEDFNILCGIAGEELSVIQTVENSYTEDLFITGEVTYVCPETGVYQFGFSQEAPEGTLYIQSVAVTEMYDYDISISSNTVTPTMLPVSQAGLLTTDVTVVNRGAQDCSGNLTVTVGNSVIATAAIPTVAAGDTVTVPVEYSLAPVAAIGNAADIEIAATINEGDDAYTTDNLIALSTTITEDMLAYDHVTADQYQYENAIGSRSGTLLAGVPIHIGVADVLTGISAGWTPETEGSTPRLGQTIQLAVYRYNPDEVIDENGYVYYALGEQVLATEAYQGNEGGQVGYRISPTTLEPGDYMVFVGFTGFCLITDYVTPGHLYAYANGYAIDQVNAGLGTPAIRAIFSDETPANIDLTVNAITSPSRHGLYASNQPISVQVTNNGSTQLDTDLNLRVNTVLSGTLAISLAPYSTASYTFTADLSAPGEYVLTAYADVAGDANIADNEVSVTVTCDEPLDPYVMDFESCTDFSIDGFNPVWTTFDGDGMDVYGFETATFPMPEDYALAFMAFNPSATTPSMSNDAAIQPYAGEKFGASFSATSGANDDWLISPLLKMPASNASLTMQVKAYNDYYGYAPEEYEVCVSTNDNNPESFTVVYSGSVGDDAWEEVIVDLSEYDGKEVYVAIHCVSQDCFVFMVDNIEIAKPISGIEESVANARLTLYPNPASETLVINAAGNCIERAEIYSAAGTLVGSVKSSNGEIRYNVSALAPGIYFARVTTEAGLQTLKFVKK